MDKMDDKARKRTSEDKEVLLLRQLGSRPEKGYHRNTNTHTASKTRNRRTSKKTINSLLQPIWAYIYAFTCPFLEKWNKIRLQRKEVALKRKALGRQKATEARIRKEFWRHKLNEGVWKALLILLMPIIALKGFVTLQLNKAVHSKALSHLKAAAKTLSNLMLYLTSRIYGFLDKAVNRMEKGYLQLSGFTAYLSTQLRMVSEGVQQRLPLRQIKRNGEIVSDENRTFVMISLAGLSGDEIKKVVSDLAKLSPQFPFKILWEGAISGSKIADHIDWLLKTSEENRSKYKEFSPRATLDFDTWRNWYLEVAEWIKRGHRSLTPFLVIPKQAMSENFQYLEQRRFRPLQISSYFLELLDTLTDWDERPFRESQEKSSSVGLLYSLTPDTINFQHDPIVIKTGNIWQREEGDRESYLSCITIYDFPEVQNLRKLLMPLVNSESRRFYLSITAKPVAAHLRKSFIKIASRYARSLTGFNSARKQAMALVNRGIGYEDAFKKALGSELKAKYLLRLDDGLGDPAEAYEQNRSFFQTSHISLVFKSDSEEDAKKFREDARAILNDNSVWTQRPSHWWEQELLLHNVLPSIKEEEVREERLCIPVWDEIIEKSLLFEDIPVPLDGIVCGVIGEELAPLSLGLSIIEAQGKPSSGKSMAAKVLASFIRLPDPERRVIVIDNSVASAAGSKTKEQSMSEANLKGWIQWCNLMGGPVIYAEEYAKPEGLVRALEKAEQERFLVYYPGRASKQHDLEMLRWLIGAMWRFHQPDKYGERDIQQMVVFDDILSWNNDRDTPQNPGHRMNYLTQDVLNQCISTGTLAFTTVQTAKAIEYGDPSSHEVVITNTDVWLNFVTSAHGDVAETIGMRGFTPESQELITKTASGLASITPGGTGSSNPGACIVTIHNVKAEMGQIYVHPDMLKVLSRKIVK